MKKRLCVMIAIFTVLLMSMSVQAETEVVRVTDNDYMDILPAVNGNSLVWQRYHDGDWEIFLNDISAAQTVQITDNNYNDISARTDGISVVWLGMDNAGGNIFLYDINSGQITQVTDNATIKSPPQIADGLVVWTTQDVTESVLPGQIELYKIATGTTTTLSAPVDPEGNLDDHTPLIRDNKVVWVQTRPDNIETTLFIYDLTTGDTFPAPDDFTMGHGPTHDGNLTITTKYDGHDREIFLNHQRRKRNEQITDNGVEEKQPKIDGNHLVWVSGQGTEQEIYLGIVRYLTAVSPGDGLISHKKEFPVFMWEEVGFDRFKVQFSYVRDFREEQTLTFPQLDSSWLRESSFTVGEREVWQLNRIEEKNRPLYWRVLAQDEYGNEKTSQVRNFTMELEDNRRKFPLILRISLMISASHASRSRPSSPQ